MLAIPALVLADALAMANALRRPSAAYPKYVHARLACAALFCAVPQVVAALSLQGGAVRARAAVAQEKNWERRLSGDSVWLVKA